MSLMEQVPASVRAVWLQRTADAMIAAGPEHFDMRSWFYERVEDFNLTYPRYQALTLIDIAHERDRITITNCGTAACMAGWLTFKAPEKVAGLIVQTSSWAADERLAEMLGINPDVWVVERWARLRDRDPELYGMLDIGDEFGSAVKFLQSLAERAAAQQTPTTQKASTS